MGSKFFGFKQLTFVNVYCDNDYAIVINLVFHDKSKHFEVELHFIREKIEKDIIKLVKVKSVQQYVDILTKLFVL